MLQKKPVGKVIKKKKERKCFSSCSDYSLQSRVADPSLKLPDPEPEHEKLRKFFPDPTLRKTGSDFKPQANKLVEKNRSVSELQSLSFLSLYSLKKLSEKVN